MFNSSSKNNFPGLAIIGRDVGLENYDNPEELQEEERKNQDSLKLIELQNKIKQNTGIDFTNKNLKYIAEPPLDMQQLFINSIQDLCSFIIDNSKIQNYRNPDEIIKKFKQQEIILNIAF